MLFIDRAEQPIKASEAPVVNNIGDGIVSFLGMPSASTLILRPAPGRRDLGLKG